jgi:hypothetical protein
MGFLKIGGELDLAKEDARLAKEGRRIALALTLLILVSAGSFVFMDFTETYSPTCRHIKIEGMCDGDKWSREAVEHFRRADAGQ